jgi:hypothetical protein
MFLLNEQHRVFVVRRALRSIRTARQYFAKSPAGEDFREIVDCRLIVSRNRSVVRIEPHRAVLIQQEYADGEKL